MYDNFTHIATNVSNKNLDKIYDWIYFLNISRNTIISCFSTLIFFIDIFQCHLLSWSAKETKFEILCYYNIFKKVYDLLNYFTYLETINCYFFS